MSSQQPVVLAPPINQIFLIHLHCLIAIFILSYYYIYNDLFSVIYCKEWCNLGITQIYVNFFKKTYKLFLWILDIREIYIKLFTNSSEIKKTKSTQEGERREIVAGCSVLAFVCQAGTQAPAWLLARRWSRVDARIGTHRMHTRASMIAGGGGRCFRIARPKKQLITIGKSIDWSLASLNQNDVP